MNIDTFFQNLLTDTEVKVMELLHENIRRQAFFGKPWPQAKNPAKKGKKLLYRSGDMQDGYMSRISGHQIIITNSVDYAGVHNEGAEIPVTVRMKKYFWAMYYKGKREKAKGGRQSETPESMYWKSLALMKVGEKIIIPERRAMDESPVMGNPIVKIVQHS